MISMLSLLALMLMCVTYTSATSSSSNTSTRRRGGSTRAIESAEAPQQDWTAEQLYPGQIVEYTNPNYGSSENEMHRAYYINHDSNLPQDPTGFGLFDSSLLDIDPSTLANHDLMNQFNTLRDSTRDLVAHMVTLRLHTIKQGRMYAPLMASAMDRKGVMDFIQYAGGDSPFVKYADTKLALASQNRLLRRIEEYAMQINLRLGNDDQDALRAIKAKVAQFQSDMAEVFLWTVPGSLCQVDQLIALHGHSGALQKIRQQEIDAIEIRNHLAQG